ncbi:hypothetical protein Dimus_029400 [Dionaea muscipula]
MMTIARRLTAQGTRPSISMFIRFKPEMRPSCSARGQVKVEGGAEEFVSTYMRRRPMTGSSAGVDSQRGQAKAEESAGEFARSGEG